MFLNPQYFANGSNCPGNNPCFHADTNSIDFNPGSRENTVWVHEIAHSIDYHAGDGSDYSTSLWVQSVPGWSQEMNGAWSFIGVPNDVASDYGLSSDPREDYAETFTWHVFTRNGWNLPSRYREPSLVRQTELQESFR